MKPKKKDQTPVEGKMKEGPRQGVGNKMSLGQLGDGYIESVNLSPKLTAIATRLRDLVEDTTHLAPNAIYGQLNRTRTSVFHGRTSNSGREGKVSSGFRENHSHLQLESTDMFGPSNSNFDGIKGSLTVKHGSKANTSAVRKSSKFRESLDLTSPSRIDDTKIRQSMKTICFVNTEGQKQLDAKLPKKPTLSKARPTISKMLSDNLKASHTNLLRSSKALLQNTHLFANLKKDKIVSKMRLSQTGTANIGDDKFTIDVEGHSKTRSPSPVLDKLDQSKTFQQSSKRSIPAQSSPSPTRTAFQGRVRVDSNKLQMLSDFFTNLKDKSNNNTESSNSKQKKFDFRAMEYSSPKEDVSQTGIFGERKTLISVFSSKQMIKSTNNVTEQKRTNIILEESRNSVSKGQIKAPKKSGSVNNYMSLWGGFQQVKNEKKTREKYRKVDVNNNSAFIKSLNHDSVMYIDVENPELNRSLDICGRILEMPKLGLKLTEFVEQETKDSVEPGTSANRDSNFDSPQGDTPEVKEAEQLLEEIMKTSCTASSLISSIKEFFVHRDKKLETEYPTRISHYELQHCIGKGSFGKVHLGVQSLTGLQVAIKAVSKKSLALDEEGKKKVQEEMRLLLKASASDGIIALLEVFESKDYFFLVTDYAAKGDLLLRLKKKGPLDEKTARGIFLDLIEAVEHLHKMRIIHRDIKLENILLCENGRVKLADFGLSKELQPGVLLNDICGTPVYQAPEIIQRKEYDGFGADIWSLGVSLYNLIYGRFPFKAERVDDLYSKIVGTDISFPTHPTTSPELRDLLCRLLQKDMKRRINIEEIKSHLWLESYSKERRTERDMSQRLRNERISLQYVQLLGFPKKYILDSLRQNALNHATACYNALIKSLNND